MGDSLSQACVDAFFGLAFFALGYRARRWALLEPSRRRVTSMAGLSPLRLVFGPKLASRAWLPGAGYVITLGLAQGVFGLVNVADALGAAIPEPVQRGVAIAFFSVAMVSCLVAIVIAVLGRPRRWMLVWPDPASFEDLSARLDRGERFRST